MLRFDWQISNKLLRIEDRLIWITDDCFILNKLVAFVIRDWPILHLQDSLEFLNLAFSDDNVNLSHEGRLPNSKRIVKFLLHRLGDSMELVNELERVVEIKDAGLLAPSVRFECFVLAKDTLMGQLS